MRRKTVLLLLCALLLAAAVGLSLSSRRAPALGLIEGRLRPCPDKPNCVCSEGGRDEEHAIAALPIRGDPDEVFAALVGRLNERHRLLSPARLADLDDYAHFEVTTTLLRFRDDLELRLDREARVIQVRSASRVGRSDLGTNRRRVEALRAELNSR
jgi:uncharacterized protein (DUF1499 family)